MKYNRISKIGDILISISKNIILFVIMATIVFYIVGMLVYYVLLMAGVNIETSALVGVIVSVAMIMILDYKKFHFHQKKQQFIEDLLNYKLSK